jgi:hypothetical protein
MDPAVPFSLKRKIRLTMQRGVFVVLVVGVVAFGVRDKEGVGVGDGLVGGDVVESE